MGSCRSHRKGTAIRGSSRSATPSTPTSPNAASSAPPANASKTYLDRPSAPLQRQTNHSRGDVMIDVTAFGGQNWLITPAARAVNEAAPASIRDQKWLLVLSGVGIVNMQGKTSDDWLHDEVLISPDVRSPLDFAIGRWGIPRPQGTEGQNYQVVFQVDQWAPFAGLNSVFDQNESVNAGFAVDDWRPPPFTVGNDAFSGQPVSNIFTGIIADTAVRD